MSDDIKQKFEALDGETKIAIKNLVTRFFMEKDSNKGKYPFIEEINTDDFYYVIDAIDIKEGNKESEKAVKEIDKYIEEFLKIFEGEKEVNEELKVYLAGLLGKSTIDKDDFELIINLAKNELYIKKIELFYDEKEDTRGNNEKESDRYPRARVYKYLEEKFGIPKEKIDELLEKNPEFKKFFYEFSSSFYCREYEREYLSRTISEREEIKEKEIKDGVEEEIKDEKHKLSYPISTFIKFCKDDGAYKKLPYTREEIIEHARKILLDVRLSDIKDKKTREFIADCFEKLFDPKNLMKFGEAKNLMKFGETEKKNKEILRNIIKEMLAQEDEQEKKYILTYSQESYAIERIEEAFYGTIRFFIKDYKKEKEEEIDASRGEIEEKIRKEVETRSEFYYRADADYREGEDISPSEKESRISPQTHIQTGSRSIKSPYISLTKSLAVAATYISSWKMGRTKKLDTSKPRAKGILVDVKKVYEFLKERKKFIEDEDIALKGEKEFLDMLLQGETLTAVERKKVEDRLKRIENAHEYKSEDRLVIEGILNFSTKEEVKMRNKEFEDSERALLSSTLTQEGKEKTTDFAYNYAPASQEILFKGGIPKDAITMIDPLTFDTLLLTDQGTKKKPIRNRFITEMIKENTNMTELLYEFLNNTEENLAKLELTEHEIYFLERYYLKGESIDTILEKINLSEDNVRKGKPEVLYDQGMRTSIIRKLLESEAFREFAAKKGIVFPQGKEIIDKAIIPIDEIGRHADRKEGAYEIQDGIYYEKKVKYAATVERVEEGNDKKVKIEKLPKRYSISAEYVYAEFKEEETARGAAKSLLKTIRSHSRRKNRRKR